MSRIGKNPINIPDGITASLEGQAITVKGKNGELTLDVHPNISVAIDAGAKQIVVTRGDDQRESRALHGLTRALIQNMVTGIVTPYEKRLEIQGVGYQASLSGKTLSLQVGYANVVKLPLPERVNCEVPDPTHITVRSIDKQALGQFAADIRHVRPPEPYKGKGIRYVGEYVRRKAGKAFASGG
ncbi:MAG: 50S ribosomal protein L6 [Planctomycetaceae bacterium]